MALKKYTKTAQLFDYQTMADGVSNAYLKSDGTLQGDNAWNTTDYIPCDGTNFVLADIGGNLISICFYDADKTFISGTPYNTGGAGIKVPVYATASNTAKYIRFSYRTGTLPDDISQLMLNEGTIALPYEPYGTIWKDIPYRRYETATDAVTNLPVQLYTDGQPVSSYTIKGNTSTSGTPSPSNPITISGCGDKTANLLNASTQNLTSGGLTTLIDFGEDVTFNELTLVSLFDNAQSGSIYGAFFDLKKADETHQYISLQAMRNSETDESFVTGTSISGNYYRTYTEPITFRYLNIYRYSNAYNKFSSGTAQIAMYADTTSKYYEPYGKYKISISSNQTALNPMYLTEQLMKIGDSVDTLASSGTVTYNIYKHELTGQETWYRTSAGKMYSSDALNGIPNYLHTLYEVTMMCSHYTADMNYGNTAHLSLNEISLYGTNGSTATREIYIYPDGYATAADYATYLQQQYANGTPVTIWFIMETPTTESVTAPSIPTTGGTATIDVDTTVKPSEFDLTYHGWHSHEPLKRENGQWS